MSTPEQLTQSDVGEIKRSERIVMLTTATADGQLVSHPMTVQEATDDADLSVSGTSSTTEL